MKVAHSQPDFDPLAMSVAAAPFKGKYWGYGLGLRLSGTMAGNGRIWPEMAGKSDFFVPGLREKANGEAGSVGWRGGTSISLAEPRNIDLARHSAG